MMQPQIIQKVQFFLFQIKQLILRFLIRIIQQDIRLCKLSMLSLKLCELLFELYEFLLNG